MRNDPADSRYGCLECREDAELAIGGRLPEAAAAAHAAHLSGCSRCRDAHAVLSALYNKPAPRAHRSSAALDREFSAILQRLHEPAPAPTRLDRAAPLLTGFLTAVACLLAVLLVSSPGKGTLPAETRIAFDDPDTVVGTIDPALIYGRVVAGQGQVIAADGHEQPQGEPAFQPGTELVTSNGESMQVQLLGKMLVNVGADSAITWESAGPRGVGLRLDRGLVAFRYDRSPVDPILDVVTPSSIVRVRGTVFTVEVDEQQQTVVSVLRGRVEVLGKDQNVIADVRAGYRFDVDHPAYSDLGRREVQIALPLSVEPRHPSSEALYGRIPTSWVVPGLPDAPSQRTLENLIEVSRRASARPRVSARALPRARPTNSILAPIDEGAALLEMLVADAKATRAEAIHADLSRCRELYVSPDTRYRSALCLGRVVEEHGDKAEAAEAHLLYGIQRMDYAGDYQAAIAEFDKFLEAAPDHPEAELARYRLWLAATEMGNLQEARRRGRDYLRTYPHGRYVGPILQRFDELVSELHRR
ncbi:MAG: FecR domain-containing protein [Nannocystaceae bacterium]